jgi:hypothetical protein
MNSIPSIADCLADVTALANRGLVEVKAAIASAKIQ